MTWGRKVTPPVVVATEVFVSACRCGESLEITVEWQEGRSGECRPLVRFHGVQHHHSEAGSTPRTRGEAHH